MHLGFICPHLNYGSGGPKVIFRLCDYLTQLGIQVTLYLNKPGNPAWLTQNKINFQIVTLEKHNSNINKNTTAIINFADGKPFAHWPSIPHILFFQGFGSQNYAQECASLMYPYTGVICTSRWLGDLAARSGHNKVFIVAPGIDDHFFGKQIEKKKETIIGTLYHDNEEKNTSLYVAGLQKFKARHPNVKLKGLFLSANPPKSRKLFESMNKSEGGAIEHSLVVKPPQHLLPYIYASCSVWVSPSMNEGFGLTTLEAMACGIPTIVYPNLGLNEYLEHNKNCFIAKDKLQITSALNSLLNDKTVYNKIVMEGLNLSAKFTWKESVNNFIQAVKEILNG
jgi:glycosyltransferase involved in cell wall biosynthesis